MEAAHLEHSPFYAPLVHPTLETGMEVLAVAALSFLRQAEWQAWTGGIRRNENS